MFRVRYGAVPVLVAGLTAALMTIATASDMEWQFGESNDPDNKGALTARLVYGVPETDNVQVTGVCDGRPSTGAKYSSLTFGTDVGADPENGQPVDLRFTGGGFDHVVKGTIHRPQSEEGIFGVHLDLEHTDPLWDALQSKTQLKYFVPGYRVSVLDLGRGQNNIGKFIAACRGYAEAILGSSSDAASSPSSDGASSTPEKDAYASAKELGTADAWKAFLANYPTGFRADLARAYLKKLSAGPGPVPPSSPPPPPVADHEPLRTATKVSCSKQGKIRSKNSNTTAKITFKNNSGAYRSILWLDFKGRPKEYANLSAGQKVTLDTYLTHPWMVTDGPGNCIEIALPRGGASLVTLGVTKRLPKKKKKKKTTKKRGCKAGYIVIEGKCIRKRDAAGYCGPGYRLKGSRCVQGYQKPKPQKQLRRGSSKAWRMDASRVSPGTRRKAATRTTDVPPAAESCLS